VFCVSVGTTLQVLPPDVMLLAEPSPEELLAAVEEAIQRVPHLGPLQQHDRVRLVLDGRYVHNTHRHKTSLSQRGRVQSASF
jgi:hypothetical protein